MIRSLRRLALAAAAFAAAAPPALAETSTYVRLTAGAANTEALKPKVDFGSGFTLAGDLDDKTGLQFSAAAGRAWRWARLEAEYQYGQVNLHDPALGAAQSDDSGASRFHAGMINGYVTAPLGARLEAFAGAGAGLAHMNVPDLHPSPTCACFSRASRTAFAYQARAGVEWRIADRQAVLVQYNHLRLPGLSGGSTPQTRYAARAIQSISLGYVQTF